MTVFTKTCIGPKQSKLYKIQGHLKKKNGVFCTRISLNTNVKIEHVSVMERHFKKALQNTMSYTPE